MKLIDLTGKTFGRLTVVVRSENEGKSVRWLCKCECGREKIVTASHLSRGITRSCGCLASESRSSRAKDLTGLRVGRLLVLRRVESKSNKTRWECLCNCGSVAIFNYQHLKDAMVTSCGCYAREVCAENGRRTAWKISGANSHLYKSELTESDRIKRRNQAEIRDWRKKVFIRDNYTCDICKERGGSLVAHHIEDWANNQDKRFDVENGITLCEGHHKAFHYSIGLRKGCNKEQYEKFKEECVARQQEQNDG
jgi:hypothetical protein